MTKTFQNETDASDNSGRKHAATAFTKLLKGASSFGDARALW